jgi:hypothetical protein
MATSHESSHPIRDRVLWLLAIAAPAAWVVVPALMALAAGPPSYEIDISVPGLGAILAMTALASFPVLICLVTVWAVLMHERLVGSLMRGAAQLVVLFLSMMAFMYRDEPRLWQMPWAVALGMASFAAPPLIVTLVLRWFRWRLFRHRGEAPVPLAPRHQFRLADLFAWMTLLAILLGLGTALLAPFHKEPTGWEGLGPAIIAMLSFFLCGPTGIGSVVFTWLVLADGRRRARAIVAVLLQLALVAWTLYVLAEIGLRTIQIEPDPFLKLATPVALTLPALALLGVARMSGWRLVRLPKTQGGRRLGNP